MTKLFTILVTSFLLSNLALAQPYPQLTETNSLSKAMLELMAMHHQYQSFEKPALPYTHEAQKNNSLIRGALAKQGVKVSLQINSNSVTSYSRDATAGEKYNSFYRAVLAK